MELEQIKFMPTGDNWRNDPHRSDWRTISIASVQGEYPPTNGEGILIREIWNSEMANFVETTNSIFTTKEMEKYLLVLRKITEDWVPLHPMVMDVEIYLHVYTITGEINNLWTYIRDWGMTIRAESHGWMGDDTYFDYFPDLVDCYLQACWGLSHLLPEGKVAQALYEELIGYLKGEDGAYGVNSNNGDEVTFPTWPEVD